MLAIAAIGFYSHRQFGTDGIAGILLGLYGLVGILDAVRRGDGENASPLSRFILKYRAALIVICILGVVGGTLDLFGAL
jgi:hypothetical protein